jgi:transposase
MSNSQAARLFSISLSSLKRSVRLADQGEALSPRKGGGRPPQSRRSHEEASRRGHKEKACGYPLAERRRFLEGLAGKTMSETYPEEDPKADGLQPKKRTTVGGAGTRRVLEGRLEGVMVAGEIDARRLVFVDEMGTNTSLSPPYGWAKKGKRAYCSVPRNRGKNATLLWSMSMKGMGPSLVVEGATTAAVFETYVEQILAPTLRKGQVVVMDNLTAHKGERVKELIEQRGCELVYLPPYSPELNPIEEAFAKIKGLIGKAEARTREALLEAIATAISALSAQDMCEFFEHCG